MIGLILFFALGPIVAFILCRIVKDRKRTRELQSVFSHSKLML